MGILQNIWALHKAAELLSSPLRRVFNIFSFLKWAIPQVATSSLELDVD